MVVAVAHGYNMAGSSACCLVVLLSWQCNIITGQVKKSEKMERVQRWEGWSGRKKVPYYKDASVV